MADLHTRAAKELNSRGIFLGGPQRDFAGSGRKQLIALLHQGMNPDSKVLDIGCGSLRGGHWMIRLLEPGCYFGIEPNREMLEAGVEVLLTPEIVAEKRPNFAYNDDFSLDVFDEKFDFYVARSIWTHASKPQIEKMLDGFVATATPNAKMMASYYPASAKRPEYNGVEWMGKSHESADAAVVGHSFEWVTQACKSRGLAVKEAPNPIFNFNTQVWLRIQHAN